PGAPAPTETSRFEIGSVTKVYTAALLADMIERGEVTLTTAVAELLPVGVTVPAFGDAAITLGDLATHRSGLPRLPPSLLAQAEIDDPYAGYDANALYADLERTPLGQAPGGRTLYSNYGAGLLGHALGLRAGGGWAAAVQARVLAPLGLADTSVEVPGGALVVGHDGDGAEVAPWTFDALAGAGALRSTVRDQLAFLRANLAAARGEPGPLAAALRRTHQVQVPDAGGGKAGALGWFIDDRDRRWHNGGTGGHHAFVAFDPARNQGVVVLASTSTSLVDRLGVDLLGVLAGESPAPLRGPSSAQLDAYVGTYADGDVGIRLVRRGPRLYSEDQSGGGDLRLLPLSPTEFYVDDLDAVVVVHPDEAQPNTIVGVTIIAGGDRIDLARVDAP
ncbi:MAG: serine hydrolase domain-containing protein, partial [Kofleriaceae bacterium]